MHLLGSDCCDHFFSQVGGMSGCERNYDFADLIHCASRLNRLASMEYGEEKLKIDMSHARQQTIWAKLHPLDAGESEPGLSNFSGLRTNVELIDAEEMFAGSIGPSYHAEHGSQYMDLMDIEVEDIDHQMENMLHGICGTSQSQCNPKDPTQIKRTVLMTAKLLGIRLGCNVGDPAVDFLGR
ncbi:hypothetical protein R1sor_026021 [Riccia sorocarpa]|uniref:Uncharacterized protein n=1 Tax=Riccia sorocarpa TaxID=122646 RepID=A0ABD3GAU1_9MARC